MKPTFSAVFLSTLFVILGGTGALLLHGASLSSHPFRMLLALLLLIAAAAIAARPLVYLLTRKTGSLFFPGDRCTAPPPAYSTADALRMKGNYTEALQKYLDIIACHPQELRAYRVVIEIALEHLDDIALAKQTLERGCAAIATEHGKQVLQDTYHEGCTGRTFHDCLKNSTRSPQKFPY